MSSSEYYTSCPECHAGLIHDYGKGEYICKKCGYVVIDQDNDLGPESHSNDFEEKSRNTRASGFTSISLHDYGLRTEIAFSSKDYSGKSIDHQIAEQMNSMRKWHSRIRIASPKERRLSNVLSKINETCSSMSLPKTLMETAAMLYRNFENRYEAKGKSISCMAAATIYLACKRCSVVRSLEEIVKATGLTEYDRSNLKLASKYYRAMVMELGVFREDDKSEFANMLPGASSANILRDQRTFPAQEGVHKPNGEYFSSKAGDASDNTANCESRTSPASSKPLMATSPTVKQSSVYPSAITIDHYISKLINVSKIGTRVERLAIDLAHKTYDHLLADGKAPNGLAAAYIYLAAVLLGINLLQVDISNLAGVTEVTIRNRCKDILINFKIAIVVKPMIKS
jgi:transcription initiation factor TFIIB